ncbi:MAG: hypothetical protein CMH49_07855 [Myxococcales bacterium]|nr:hypothetical protein [Myxococcales bacterium]
MQTAEGALNETTNILQRMRELTVQAGNETLNVQDRESLQGEMNQLMSELDRINEATNFNNKKVFSQHETVSLKQSYANGGELNNYKVNYAENEDLTPILGTTPDADSRREFALGYLKGGWLQESERMIEEHFGLFGSGQTVNVDFIDGGDAPGGSLAFVSGNAADPSGPFRMHIDLSDFDDTNAPDGGNPNMFSDRIIAHEMVHVAQFSNGILLTGTDEWFNEGTAEFLVGAADTRMSGLAAANYNDGANALTNAFNTSGGGGIDYEEAYIAVAFMHQEVINNGGQGIQDILNDMAGGTSLNDAVGARTAHADLGDFKLHFQTIGVGDTFAALLKNHSVSTGDTGSIAGSFFGGSTLDARAVVANEELSTEDKKGGQKVDFHIGANTDDSLGMYVGSFNVDAMGLRNVDLTDHSRVDFALYGLDDALNYVSDMRADLGAMQNRLTSTVNSLQVNVENTSASRSRIMDADFASETLSLSKAQIIQQASTSMLAQANVQPQLALALLN